MEKTEEKNMTLDEVSALQFKAGAVAEALDTLYMCRDRPEEITEFLLLLRDSAQDVREGLEVLANEKDHEEMAAHRVAQGLTAEN